jgi:hypothetical protein
MRSTTWDFNKFFIIIINKLTEIINLIIIKWKQNVLDIKQYTKFKFSLVHTT